MIKMPLDFSLLEDSTLTSGKVSPTTGLDFSVLEGDKDYGITLPSTPGYKEDPSKYKKYIDSFHPEFGQEYNDILRSYNQSGLGQAGAALGQSAAEIVGGTIEGFGHLETGIRELVGAENDWSNFMIELGQGIKDKTREAMPIYQHPDDIGKFRPNRWSWWMSNAPSMASSLSLMIPSSGVIRGFSMLGEAAGIAGKMGKVAQAAGLVKNAKAAEKLIKAYSTVLGQAGVSRLMENGMEASGVYKESFDNALRLGFSNTQAKQAASIAASDTWNKNWVMLLQDIPQYAVLGRSLTSASKDLTPAVAKALGLPTTALKTKTAYKLIGDALGEGGEEMYQYIVGENAKHHALSVLDSNYTYKPSIGEYLKEGELWTSFTMGALGAGLMQTVGRKLNDKVLNLQGKQTEDQQRIANIATWGPAVKAAQENLSKALETGDDIKIQNARTDLASSIQAKADEVGNGDAAINLMTDMFQGQSTEQIAQVMGLSAEQAQEVKENFPDLLKDMEDTKMYFERYNKSYSPRIASQMARNSTLINKFNESATKQESVLNGLKKTIPGYSSLSSDGQREIELNSSIKSIQSTIKKVKGYHEKIKDSLDENEIKEYDARISYLNNVLNHNTEELKDLVSNKSKEDKEKDKGISIPQADIDELNKVNKSIQANKAAAMSYEAFNKALEKTAAKLKKGEATPVHSDDNTEIEKASQQKPKAEEEQSVEDIQREEDLKDVKTLANKIAEGGKATTKEEKRLQEDYFEEINAELDKLKQAVTEDLTSRTTEDLDDGLSSITEEAPEFESEYGVSATPFEQESFEQEYQAATQNDTDTTIEAELKEDLKDGSETIDYIEPTTEGSQSPVETIDIEEEKLPDTFGVVYFEEDSPELIEYLTNTKDLNNVVLEYEIDYDSPYWGAYSKQKDKAIERLKKGNLEVSQPDKTTNLVDEVPIRVKFMVNGKEVPSKMYLYTTGSSYKKTYKMTKQERKDLADKNRRVRLNILNKLVKGDKVTSSDLYLTGGKFNNISGRAETPMKAFDTPVDDILLYYRDRSGQAVSTRGIQVIGVSDTSKHGNIYIYTDKTPSGKKVPVKLNPSKLTYEDANLILNAFISAFKNKSYKSLFKDPQVTPGYSVKKALDTLVYWGDSTKVDVEKVKSLREALRNTTTESERESLQNELDYEVSKESKQLFERDGILYYGLNKLDLRSLSSDQRKDFIQYLMDNKNYSFPAKDINKVAESEYKAGGITIQAGATLQKSYLESKTLMSDIQLTESGHIFRSPQIRVAGTEYTKSMETPKENTPIETKPTGGIEAKKADIEKRRQEELVSKTIFSKFPNTKIKRVLYHSNYWDFKTFKGLSGNLPFSSIKEHAKTLEEAKKLFGGQFWFNFKPLPDEFGDKKTLVIINSNSPRIIDYNESSDAMGLGQESSELLKRIGADALIGSSTIEYETAPSSENIRQVISDLNEEVVVDSFDLIEVISKEEADLINKINAKYDAELDALENKQTKLDKDIADEIRDELFQLKQSTKYVKGDINQALKNIDRVLGDVIPVAVQKDLIKVATKAGTKQAFGRFHKGIITLSEALAEGTEYHEAFHAVTQMLLTKEELSKIYYLASEKYNIDRSNIVAIEERLAEDFRSHMLKSKTKAKADNAIIRLFNRILRLINRLFKGPSSIDQLTIDRLFKDIESGKYRNAKVKNYPEGTNVDLLHFYQHGFTGEQQHQIVDALMYQMFTKADVQFIEDVNKLKFEDAEAFIDAIISKLKASNHEATLVWESVKEQKDYFKRLVNDKFMSIGIKSTTDDVEIDDGLQNYDKASYEFDAKQNVLGNIKLFLATLPTKESDPFTQCPKFISFTEAWSKLQFLTHKAENYQELEALIKEAAASTEDTDMSHFYSLISEGTKLRKGLYNMSESFKTQIWTSLKKHRHDFVKIKAYKDTDKNYKVNVFSSEKFDIAQNLKRTWGTAFEYSTGLFDTYKNINKKAITLLTVKYKQLQKDFLKDYVSKLSSDKILEYKDTIRELLSSIGMAISDTQINDIISHFSSTNSNDGLNAFITTLSNVFGDGKYSFSTALKESDFNKISPYTVFSKDNSISNLSNILAESSESVQIDSILGPNGNLFYAYSQNSFITEEVNNLNKPEVVKQKSNTVNNTHSRFLNQLKNNPNRKIRFVAFGSFNRGKDNRNKPTTDKDYLTMDSQEHLVAMYHAMLGKNNKGKENALMPLPTLSDKKSFGFLEGFDLIKYEASIDENGMYVIPDNVIDIFYNYYLDEQSRIAQVKQEVDEAIENKDYANLIQNYHFKGYKSDGVTPELKDSNDKYTGNGTKSQLFHGGKDAYSKDHVRKVLYKNLKDTVDLFAKEGLIKSSTDGNITYISGSDLLDSRTLNTDFKRTIQGLAGMTETDSTLVYTDAIARFTFNYMSSMIETSKLFIGDPAFYKDLNESTAEDLSKRLAAIIAPGDNLRVDFLTDEYNAGVKGENEYKSITLKTHKDYSEDVYNELRDLFTKAYNARPDEVNSNQSLEEFLDSRLLPYKSNDVTDAQVYITPEFYRNLAIRLGEWGDVKDSQYQTLMSLGEDASREDIIKASQVVMQPLKFVYFGNRYHNNTMIPLYDKMSLATLVPQMIKGTKLEELANHMRGNNIGMAKFDSAVKAGNTPPIKYFKEDGSINTESLQNSTPVYQEFKNLRRQQITTPHYDSERKLGTQATKIAVANLNLINSIYKVRGLKKKINGVEIKKRLNNCYKALSNQGRSRLNKEIGLEGGKLSNEKLYEMLRTEAKRSGSPYNFIYALEPDASGNFISFDSFMTGDKIESRLISMVSKRTVDITTGGDAFFQMSTFGLQNKDPKTSKKLKLIDSEGRTEVMLSVSLFKHVIPEYENITFEEKVEWLKDNIDGIGYRIPTQGQASMIAFNIVKFLPENTANAIVLPEEITTLTGSDFDIDKMFLARYQVDKNGKKISFIEGDTNNDKVLERLYQANNKGKIHFMEFLENLMIKKDEGQDFSEYEMLILRNNYPEMFPELGEILHKEIKEAYDKVQSELVTLEEYIATNKGADIYTLNTKQALQNHIIDIMQSVLTNPEHIIHTKTPLDYSTSIIKNDILKDIDKLRGGVPKLGNLESVTPSYQLKVKDNNSSGKTGIGPFALHIANHALTQGYDFGVYYNHTYGATKVDREYLSLSGIYDVDGEYIMEQLSALVNAHVDIAKDPYIFRLNVNPNTYDILAYMVRAGLGKKSYYFLNQASIVDFAEGLNKAKFANSTKLMANTTIKQILNKAKANAKAAGISEDDVLNVYYKFSSPNNVFTKEDSLKDLRDGIKPRGYLNNQASPYELAMYYAKQAGYAASYVKLNKKAKSLSSAIQASRIDTKGYGNNLTQVRLFGDRLLSVLEKDTNLRNFDKVISESFLSTLANNSIFLIPELFKHTNLKGTESFNSLVKDILAEVGTQEDYITERKVNAISKALLSSIKSEYFISPEGHGLTPHDIFYMIKGDKAVGKRLYGIKLDNPEASENKLLKSLSPRYHSESGTWVIEVTNTDRNDAWTADEITNSWLELMNHPDESIMKFAYDLVDYSFISSGFNSTYHQFHQYIPYEYYTLKSPSGISLDEFIKSKLELFSSSLDPDYSSRLIEDVVLNNTDILPTLNKINYSTVKGLDGSVQILKGEGLDQFYDYGELIPPKYVKYSIKQNNKYREVIAEVLAADYSRLVVRVLPNKGYSKVPGHYFNEYNDQGAWSVFTDNYIYDSNSLSKEALYNKISNMEDVFKGFSFIEYRMEYEGTISTNVESEDVQKELLEYDQISTQTEKEEDMGLTLSMVTPLSKKQDYLSTIQNDIAKLPASDREVVYNMLDNDSISLEDFKKELKEVLKCL